ncbi:hypothetical protein OAQ01_00065 [Emcibacteraceae bacterium]|nr:hypothetical protein [Emcibacteraceae bacterium]
MDLSYILEKIEKAIIQEDPFRHIEIPNLFNNDDFEKIVSSSDIRLNPSDTDADLFANLFNAGYKIISFPGCTTDHNEYIKWHREKKTVNKTNTACEGFGVVLRLDSPASDSIKELNAFLNSDDFLKCIASKFGISLDQCKYDAGIQKYLDGYEISPHPDIRRKALTYMVNVNPNPESHLYDFHTSYLKFKPKWNYIKHLWEGNETTERCWVPWDWCDVIKQQRNNNSMVLFSPDNDTMHAVKAIYDHKKFQRTQLYGNLWYKETVIEFSPEWENLWITNERNMKKGLGSTRSNLKDKVKSILPIGVKSVLKKISEKKHHAKRNY